jgi:hypothetical protein
MVFMLNNVGVRIMEQSGMGAINIMCKMLAANHQWYMYQIL